MRTGGMMYNQYIKIKKRGIYMNKRKISICEWNVNQATDLYGANEIPEFIGSEIVKRNPDIFVLTEIVKCKGYESFANYLKENGYSYEISCNNSDVNDKQNDVLIAWKENMFEKLSIDNRIRTSRNNNCPNFLLVKLKRISDKKIINVVGLRITIQSFKNRKKQMEMVFKHLTEISNVEECTIITGDFNNNRRGYQGEWSMNILDSLAKQYGFTLFTPEGSSIGSEHAWKKEYEFAEDHFLVNKGNMSEYRYDRDFAYEYKDIYLHGGDFRVYVPQLKAVVWKIDYGCGVPDHAILQGMLEL